MRDPFNPPGPFFVPQHAPIRADLVHNPFHPCFADPFAHILSHHAFLYTALKPLYISARQCFVIFILLSPLVCPFLGPLSFVFFFSRPGPFAHLVSRRLFAPSSVRRICPMPVARYGPPRRKPARRLHGEIPRESAVVVPWERDGGGP